MREIRTEIEVAVSQTEVWDKLVDFENWKHWNPISQASGRASLGGKLDITMSAADGKTGNRYVATIKTLEAPRLLHWQASMGAQVLFTNDKILELIETDRGTKLVHRETFSGLLVSLFWKKLEAYVPGALNQMNAAFKQVLEKP